MNRISAQIIFIKTEIRYHGFGGQVVSTGSHVYGHGRVVGLELVACKQELVRSESQNQLKLVLVQSEWLKPTFACAVLNV